MKMFKIPQTIGIASEKDNASIFQLVDVFKVMGGVYILLEFMGSVYILLPYVWR